MATAAGSRARWRVRAAAVLLLSGLAVAPLPAADIADWRVTLLGRDQPVALKAWIGQAPCAFVVIARGDVRQQPDLISRGADDGFYPLPPPLIVPRLVIVLDDGPWPPERLLAADWGRATADAREAMGELAHGTLYLLGRGGRPLSVFSPGESRFKENLTNALRTAREHDLVPPDLYPWLGDTPWTADAGRRLIDDALLRYARGRWESRALITETCAWLANGGDPEDAELQVAMLAGALDALAPQVPRERAALEAFTRQWQQRAAAATRPYARMQGGAALVLARIEAGHQAAVKDDPRWLLVAARFALMDPTANARVWLDQALQHPRLTPELRDEAEQLRAQLK